MLLSDDDIREYRLLKELDKIKGRSTLADFINYTRPGYQMKWFHKLICDKLDELIQRKHKKLMIFLGPQHGKSEISSRCFPSYALGKNPKTKIGIISYNSSLARGFNRSCQLIIDDEKYRELFPETTLNEKNISTDSRHGVLRNSEIFEIVKHHGFLKTVGVGGPLTGTPIDIGIIDDPFKDRQEANSQVYRDRVWAWYNDVFLTRLHNDSIQLMLYTRWHEDDLAGRLIDPRNKLYDEKEAKEWTVIAIPTLKEDTKPIECAIDIDDPREIDEALWPEKHAAEKYYKRRVNNPIGFNSLDQQRPTAEGGNKIKRDWFPIIKKSELPFNPASKVVNFWVDGAYTDKTSNDETGLMAEIMHEGTLYIMNCTGVRKELYQFLEYFPEYVKSNGGSSRSLVNIELKASGNDMKSMISKPQFGNFNAVGIRNKAVGLGKYNRVENAEPFILSGKVVLVEGGWNTRFLDQVTSFPNGLNDDMVDVLTYAVDKYMVNDEKARGAVSYTD